MTAMTNPNEEAQGSLIDQVFNLFSSSREELDKTFLFACQHIRRPREAVLPKLVEFGLRKENVFLLGKVYSTSRSVFSQLKRAGFNIYQPISKKESFEEQHKSNCRWLFELFLKTVPPHSTVIVLDDGAGLLLEFNAEFAKINKNITILGVEQTSSGFRKLEHTGLNFPVINVARSSIKLNDETPHVVAVCLEELMIRLQVYKFSEKNRYLVIGLGPIGQSFMELIRQRGYKATGFDLSSNQGQLLEKIKKFKANIIVGATGARAMTGGDVENLKTLGWPIYLASLSSSDCEFPAAQFRQREQKIDSFEDIKTGSVTILNNGFPINFNARHNVWGLEWIEKTICLLFGSVLYLATTKQPHKLNNELLPVPKMVTKLL